MIYIVEKSVEINSVLKKNYFGSIKCAYTDECSNFVINI